MRVRIAVSTFRKVAVKARDDAIATRVVVSNSFLLTNARATSVSHNRSPRFREDL